MKKFVLVLSVLFSSLLFSSSTYATRVEVDVNNLNNYFSSFGYSNSASGSNFIPGSDQTSRRLIYFTLNSNTITSVNCSSVYSRIVYGDNFNSFTPVSTGNVYNYVSGSFNNGIVYYSGRNNFATVYSADLGYELTQGQTYTFQSIILGCSEQEVAYVAPTPTPTPTPTETPTPTPTESPTPTPTETLDPSDYEYNAVEDSVIKYRFISWVIIVSAGLLLYHLVIKRIILK